jgi:GR25 family glycosyltransferase involved in LPS biosynthesis
MNEIDLILYINLEHRKDRKEHILNEFKSINIPVCKIVRMDAIKSGFTGCTKSHIKALQFAMDSSCESVMICEDDWMIENVETFNRSIDLIKNVPFNVFMVSMTPISFLKANTGIVKIKQSLGMGCYIVKRKYFQNLLNIFYQALNNNQPHDLITQLYQDQDFWYGFFPVITRQLPGWSDIENKFVNYKNLEDGTLMQKEEQKENIFILILFLCLLVVFIIFLCNDKQMDISTNMNSIYTN